MTEDEKKPRPVLGLYGLELLCDSAPPPPAELAECAQELGIDAVLVDFPELMPQAGDIFKELKTVLPSIAVKMKLYVTCSVEACTSASDYIAALDGKLACMGVGHADCAVFGPVSMRIFRQLDGSGFRMALSKAKASGRISEAGIWIADRVEYAEQAAQAFPELDCLRLDYTPLDFIDRPGAYAYKIAEKYGLSVMSSGIHIGSSSETRFPAVLSQAWRAENPRYSLSSQLIRWNVMMQGNQSLVLSPRSARELEAQLLDIREAAGRKMTVSQKLLQNNLRDICQRLQPVSCTACGCCMPCPFNVDIPGLMAIYNDSVVYGDVPAGTVFIRLLRHDVVKCRDCGRCLDECPKHNRIPEVISELKKWTGSGK